MDGLHHFTEHMRHRRRVHELEAEVASLRAHLDQLLEMPDHSTSKLPDRIATALPAAENGATDIASTEVSTTEPEREPEPEPVVSTKKSRSAHRKRLALEVAGGTSEPAPAVDGNSSGASAADAKPAESSNAVERES
jgi:hypothetical protein